MREVVETDPVRAAERMAFAVCESDSDSRVGQIIGAPGTGKTMAGHHLAKSLSGIRVCAGEHMTAKELLFRVVERITGEAPRRLTLWGLMRRLEQADGQLLVIDEANHLGWQQLELLRWLSDEADYPVILIGTELLDRPFLEGRTSVLLAQLSSRIGAKRVTFKPFGEEEVAAYCLGPEFGKVTMTTARSFYRHTKGFWRDARQLVDACKRVMEVRGIERLNTDVIDAAALWMVTRRTSN